MFVVTVIGLQKHTKMIQYLRIRYERDTFELCNNLPRPIGLGFYTTQPYQYLDNHLLPGIYFPLSVSLYLFVSVSHKYKSFSDHVEIVNEIGFNRHNLT